MGLVVKLAAILVLGAGGIWHEAYAVRYDVGVFGRVARNRGMSIVSCMAAHPELPLGTWIAIEGPAGEEEPELPTPANRAIGRGISSSKGWRFHTNAACGCVGPRGKAPQSSVRSAGA